MGARIAAALVAFSTLGSACISHTPTTHHDGAVAHEDAAVEIDATMADDAAPPEIDAFVMPDDAGHDASVMPVDASHCIALPTSTPLVIHGTISSGPTYDRQTADCAGLSTVGNAVFYSTHVLCNGGAMRSFSFGLDAAASGGIPDPFVVIETGMGDVSTLTCLAADDDGAGVAHNSLARATVPASGTITVVASDYDNAVTGDYVLTITPL